jgi:hypothetical protein
VLREVLVFDVRCDTWRKDQLIGENLDLLLDVHVRRRRKVAVSKGWCTFVTSESLNAASGALTRSTCSSTFAERAIATSDRSASDSWNEHVSGYDLLRFFTYLGGVLDDGPVDLGQMVLGSERLRQLRQVIWSSSFLSDVRLAIRRRGTCRIFVVLAKMSIGGRRCQAPNPACGRFILLCVKSGGRVICDEVTEINCRHG